MSSVLKTAYLRMFHEGRHKMTKLVPKVLYIIDLSIHKSSVFDTAAIRVWKTTVLKNTPKVLPSQCCVFCEKLCAQHIITNRDRLKIMI